MGNPKRHEGGGKERAPGMGPQGQRPMREGGDRQPGRRDWREQAQMGGHQGAANQPQQGHPQQGQPQQPQGQQPKQQQQGDPHADPHRREAGQGRDMNPPRDPREQQRDDDDETEGTDDTQRKGAYR